MILLQAGQYRKQSHCIGGGGGNIVVYIEKFKTVRGATTKDQCKVNERGIGSWQGALGPPLAMRK